MAVIQLKNGDIFKSYADALVNPVNCVGVSGAGLALEFKKRFPDNYDAYRKACIQGELLAGLPYIHTVYRQGVKLKIINFPTKRHWKQPSMMNDIKTGLYQLARQIPEEDIASIAMPPIGCGLGGLYWIDVYQEVMRYLFPIENLRIELYGSKAIQKTVNKGAKT